MPIALFIALFVAAAAPQNALDKHVHGFATGDLVRAELPAGKHAGVHIGRVAVRASGSFRVGTVDGISWRHCRLLQRADGYEYAWKGGVALPPQP